MEEDAGKLDACAGSSAQHHFVVDYNRAGDGPAEIVFKHRSAHGREAAESRLRNRRISCVILGRQRRTCRRNPCAAMLKLSVRRGPNDPFGVKGGIKEH